jgi:hypothetical protein
MNVLVGVTQHRDSHMTRFLKAPRKRQAGMETGTEASAVNYT